MSQTFEVNIGVRQANNILLLIFNILLEEAIQKIKNSAVGIRLRTKITILALQKCSLNCVGQGIPEILGRNCGIKRRKMSISFEK